MPDSPYSFEPVAGYRNYKVTSMLRDYLGLLLEAPENQETIEQILGLINGYIAQLESLRQKHAGLTLREVNLAIDGFFDKAAAAEKAQITCRAGCTACCFIDLEVSVDEAANIVDYCRKNAIAIDHEYLTKQAVAGRQSYSSLSQCVFLKDNLCSIYPVRPVACRKHWVKTDPALCDFSENKANQVGRYFDINTEILTSAVLNISETGPFEKMLLSEIDKTSIT